MATNDWQLAVPASAVQLVRPVGPLLRYRKDLLRTEVLGGKPICSWGEARHGRPGDSPNLVGAPMEREVVYLRESLTISEELNSRTRIGAQFHQPWGQV